MAPSARTPVLHAVVPREVRACLGCGENIIGGHGIGGMRKRDLLDRCAEAFQGLYRIPHRLVHLRVHAFDEIFLRDADLHALDVLFERRGKIRHRDVRGRGILGIMAGDDIHEDRRIRHVLGDRADLVKRRRERHETVAGDPAVGRLEPHDAAAGRRLADGAARIRAERRDALARCHRGRRSAARSAGDPFEVPGILGDEKTRVLRRRPHGKLIHVRFAADHGARLLQLPDHGRVIGRDEVPEDLRSAGGPDALGAHVVLDRDEECREAVTRVACLDPLVRLGGLRRRAVSPVTVMYALTLSSTALILPRTDSVTARAVVSPFFSMSCSSWIVRLNNSMPTPCP